MTAASPPAAGMRAALGIAFLLAAALAGDPRASASQVPRGDAGWTGTAETGTAELRGVTSVGANPALLGLDGTPRASLALLSGAGALSLDPLDLEELAQHQGSELSPETREAWLGRIARAGGIAGDLEAHAGPLGLQVRRVAAQVTTTAVGRARLDEDAAELLLFGNAGRERRARDLAAEEAEATGALFTTVSTAAALPLENLGIGPLRGGRFAAGVAVHLVWGHALAVARDRGSVASADPAGFDFQFAFVDPSSGAGRAVGRGLSVDVGGAWSGDRGSWSLSIRNAVNGFRWDEERLRFRAGEASYQEGLGGSDLARHPFPEAPEELRDEVAALRFAREVAVSGAWDATPATTLLVEGRHGPGSELSPGPASLAGVGVAHRWRSRFRLRGGAAWIPDGYQVGTGAGLDFRAVELQAGIRLRSDGRGRLPEGALGLVVRL